jgi:FdhE protein
MTTVGKSRGAAIDIGEVAAPPFVRLPVPEVIFAERAARLRALLPGHALADALAFFAAIVEAQHVVQGALQLPEPSSSAAVAQALEHGMPPLNRYTWSPDQGFRAIARGLAAELSGSAKPPPAEASRRLVASVDDALLGRWATDLLAAEAPADAAGPMVFIGAALQVHFARLASTLDAGTLKPIGHGACPCCGSPPVASAVVGWPGAHGARFLFCALCGAAWDYIRIKCVACGTTKGIAYYGFEGENDLVKAETCEACGGYLKVFQQHKVTVTEPHADDLATLGLDLKLREAGWRRIGGNLLLSEY